MTAVFENILVGNTFLTDDEQEELLRFSSLLAETNDPFSVMARVDHGFEPIKGTPVIQGEVVDIYSTRSGDYVGYYDWGPVAENAMLQDSSLWRQYSSSWAMASGLPEKFIAMAEDEMSGSNLMQVNEQGDVTPLDQSKEWYSELIVQGYLSNGYLPYTIDEELLEAFE